MNWEFIMKYLPLYQKAAVLTVKIGTAGIICAVLIGLLCTAVQDFRVPVLRQAAKVYIEISRNTPLLIQLFFIYYGLPKIGIRTNGVFTIFGATIKSINVAVGCLAAFFILGLIFIRIADKQPQSEESKKDIQ